MSEVGPQTGRARRRRTGITIACLVAVICVAAILAKRSLESAGPAGTATGTSTTSAKPPPTPPLDAQRYASKSSVAAPDGANWEFAEGLSIRIIGATRLPSDVGTQTKDHREMTLVRIDFSYTNNGAAANVSEGRELPVRLLYGIAQNEAIADGGYVGSSDQLTLRVPTRVEPGATVHGAVSFAVPATATAVLAVLVVEPRRFTQHLFTEVQDLFVTRGA